MKVEHSTDLTPDGITTVCSRPPSSAAETAVRYPGMSIESAEEFRRLRLSEDPDEYLRADHEEAPIEVWREVCTRWPDLRLWVAHNKTVPVEILRELSSDQDSDVRGWVARKRKLPVDIQILMAKDPDASVRASLAYNGKLVDEVRAILLDDREQFVREAAGNRRGTG